MTRLGDWMSDLFGKSQSWYDRVDRIQKDIAVLVAEVNAAGAAVWNTVFNGLTSAGAYPPGLSRFTDFTWTTEDLIEQQKNVLITNKKTPSDQEISTAESRVGLYRSMVDYVKRVAPELSVKIQGDGEQIRAALSQNSLISPAVVGVETFKEELERRSKILGGSTLTIVLVLAGITAAAWGFAKGGRR